MKTLILTLTCFFVIESRASVVEVIGACDEKPQFVSENILHDEKMTLGDLTIQVLEKNQIPFRGSREGIAAIFDSPTGDEAIEKVSEEEMRFYGWCVHVDGFEPGDMPDEVFLKNPNSKITWFYAYASTIKDRWEEICVPSYTKKSLKICNKQE